MENEVVTHASTALLGGAVASIAAWARDRKKIPAQVDSIIVDSAATTTQQALALAKAEADRADRAEAKVAVLERKLEEIQRALDGARMEIQQLAREIARK